MFFYQETVKHVAGFYALCTFCGYLSLNFANCERCKRKLPGEIKMVPTANRKLNTNIIITRTENPASTPSTTASQPISQLQVSIQNYISVFFPSFFSFSSVFSLGRTVIYPWSEYQLSNIERAQMDFSCHRVQIQFFCILSETKFRWFAKVSDQNHITQWFFCVKKIHQLCVFQGFTLFSLNMWWMFFQMYHIISGHHKVNELVFLPHSFSHHPFFCSGP